jgi:hypothetical protein
MVNKKVANKLWARLTDELERRCNLLDMAENGLEPESMFDDIWTPGFGQPVKESVIKDPIGGGDTSKPSPGWSNAWPTMPTGH